MKAQYVLPALFVLAATVATSQAMATGLTYDPYENYYHDYYGIDAEEIARQAIAKSEEQSKQLDATEKAKKVEEDTTEYADPRNFYTW